MVFVNAIGMWFEVSMMVLVSELVEMMQILIQRKIQVQKLVRFTTILRERSNETHLSRLRG